MCPFLLHAGLQILDGLLTLIGVHRLGIEAEGNPLVKFLMETFGPIPAMVCMKTLAILILFKFVKRHSDPAMLGRTMALVNSFYTVTAAVWIYVLFIQ